MTNNIGKCASCKRWSQEAVERFLCHDDSQVLGYCYAGCDSNLAIAVYDSVYADLITDAKFGCILYDAKS